MKTSPASLVQRFARGIYPYGAEARVLRGPVRSMRFVVEPGIGVTYALGLESAGPRFLAERVRSGMTVFDVGANKGQMALLFAALVGPTGRVIALEPAPEEFRSLQRNVELNGLSRVRSIRAAAAESHGEAAFAYPADRPTQGKLLDVELTYVHSHAEQINVRTLPLDSLIDEESLPDLIKIDVEGAAASVLRGASKILADVRPVIYLELHGPEEQAGVRDELIRRGYAVETLDGRRIADPTAGWFSPLWCYKPSGHA